MPSECIPYQKTNYFTQFIADFLNRKKELKPFYNRFPALEDFEGQIREKQQSFTSEKREVLVKKLQQQYQNLETSEATEENIQQLLNDNTFTVTTGHQLNLFTGPLYFLYKIVSAVNLASELKEKYSEYNFVPVYWMATEDHDLEEIQFFKFKNEKISWEKTSGGAVGELSTEGLDAVYEKFASELPKTEKADRLKQLFKKAYLEHENLADATRYLANELFKDYGLVIVDANNREMKKLFVPAMERELFEQSGHKNISKTCEDLEKSGYDAQVNPREINLFYMPQGMRERIIERDGKYFVNDHNISWSKEELKQLLHENPEQFSPNVLLRPLYQEIVFPNLCYIGGGAEVAYWLELKDFFNSEKVPFPIVMLRNSALLQMEKQAKKTHKLDISTSDLFLPQHELTEKRVREISEVDIDFSKQKNHLVQQFQDLYVLAEKTDKSFLGAVKAQEVKQLKGLENLEKRLLKAQKRKLSDEVERLKTLQNDLFPNQSLQERQLNFSEFYLECGEKLIPILMEELKPLDLEFTIITLQDA